MAAEVAEGFRFEGADLVGGQVEGAGGFFRGAGGVVLESVAVDEDGLVEVVEELEVVGDVAAEGGAENDRGVVDDWFGVVGVEGSERSG